MKKVLSSAQANQQLGEIVFYKTDKTVKEYKVDKKTGKRLPIYDIKRTVMKRVPLLVYHVADGESHDKKAPVHKEDRIGEPTTSCMGKARYETWIKNLVADVYDIRDLKDVPAAMLNVTFPPYYDVMNGEDVIEEGVLTKFKEAVEK